MGTGSASHPATHQQQHEVLLQLQLLCDEVRVQSATSKCVGLVARRRLGQPRGHHVGQKAVERLHDTDHCVCMAQGRRKVLL